NPVQLGGRGAGGALSGISAACAGSPVTSARQPTTAAKTHPRIMASAPAYFYRGAYRSVAASSVVRKPHSLRNRVRSKAVKCPPRGGSKFELVSRRTAD